MRTGEFPVLFSLGARFSFCHADAAPCPARPPTASNSGWGHFDQYVACLLYGDNQSIPVTLLDLGCWMLPAASPGRKAAMENHRDELRYELSKLLKKQADVLESRTFGAATDTELLEYEIRQEIIHEICDQLAHSPET